MRIGARAPRPPARGRCGALHEARRPHSLAARADPRARRERLRGRQPRAQAARAPLRRGRDDEPHAGLAARGPAGRQRTRVRRARRRSTSTAMLDEVRPRTVFNCIAYGAYSFETDGELILRTNLMSTHALLERLATRNLAAYIHAGSSSEYGENAAGPEEHDFLAVNSDYAVSKAACAHLIHYYGKHHGLPARQPAPLLRLRPARGSLAAHAEDRAARRARRAAAARRSAHLARFRLQRRRRRRVRGRCERAAGGRLSATPSTSAPAARRRSASSRRSLASSTASSAAPSFTMPAARWDVGRLVRQQRRARAPRSAGRRRRRSRTASSA